MSSFLTKKYYNKLASVYNILDTIEFKEFDRNFDALRTRLGQIKREQYDVNDKVVIAHFDTDYYDDKMLCFGLNLYNVITLITELDIPYFVFVFVTNHFGLQQEIDLILKDHPIEDRPKIIETFIIRNHYNSTIVEDLPVNTQEIKYAGLSMMGKPRSHRFSLYNYLIEHELSDNVQVSIRGFKE